jgi:1-acyl-sn-glycerol-3-phosphate acyltransferase
MYEIMQLSGQEYVDIYATKAKALDKEAARKGGAEAKRAEDSGSSELKAS